MCGIAGYFGFEADEALLQRMNACQQHRGPDGEGVLTDGPVVDAGTVTGIVTRSDILGIYGRHLHKSRTRRRTIELGLKGAR